MRTPLLFYTLLSVVCSYNIVIYTLLVGKSHLDFSSTLIDKLVERGHTVDHIIARMNTKVKSNGTTNARRVTDFTFDGPSPWLAAGHLNDPFSKPTTSDEVFLDFFSQVTSELCKSAVKDDRLLDFLKEGKYDLALTTPYDYCSVALFNASGIDNVLSFSATTLFASQAFAAGLPTPVGYVIDPLSIEFDHLRFSFLERMENLIRVVKYEWFHYPTFVRLTNNVVRARFGNSFPDVGLLAAQYNIMFVNSNELLEEPRPISHKLKFIGGINMKKAKPISKQFDVILSKAKKGNVLFSFGTQVPSANIPPIIRHAFIAAFRRFPEYNFIWKYDVAEDEKHLFANASNVVPVEWLPQTDLLQDHRVVAFISHVGLNSLLEAAYAGVPIIALPLFADQVWNANIAKKHNIAVVLNKYDITEDTVFRALSKVLQNEEMSADCLKMSKMLKAKPAQAERLFVEWVEYAAEFKNLHSHFNLQGATMSGFVANGYDVVLALSAVFLLTILIGVHILLKITKFAINNTRIVKKIKEN